MDLPKGIAWISWLPANNITQLLGRRSFRFAAVTTFLSIVLVLFLVEYVGFFGLSFQSMPVWSVDIQNFSAVIMGKTLSTTVTFNVEVRNKQTNSSISHSDWVSRKVNSGIVLLETNQYAKVSIVNESWIFLCPSTEETIVHTLLAAS